MKTKQCVLCREYRPRDSYHRNKRNGDGRENRCPECRSELARTYRQQHRETLVAQTRRYQEKNREYFREYNKRYRELRREATS